MWLIRTAGKFLKFSCTSEKLTSQPVYAASKWCPFCFSYYRSVCFIVLMRMYVQHSGDLTNSFQAPIMYTHIGYYLISISIFLNIPFRRNIATVQPKFKPFCCILIVLYRNSNNSTPPIKDRSKLKDLYLSSRLFY